MSRSFRGGRPAGLHRIVTRVAIRGGGAAARDGALAVLRTRDPAAQQDADGELVTVLLSAMGIAQLFDGRAIGDQILIVETVEERRVEVRVR